VHLRLIRHGEVDSTSERAFATIASGTAAHGDVHVATAQTRGRGRLGRAWSSPAGEGVYLSLVLLPPPPPWSPAALTIAAGLAVFDAATALGVRGARLDWPNDLVVGKAKLAGVLVETRGLDPRAPHYVVGVGLNVLQRVFPPELRAEREVASLATLGVETTVEQALEAMLETLPRRLDRLPLDEPALAADYLGATGLLGARVRVGVGEVNHEGVLEGLTVAEGLRLRRNDEDLVRFPLEVVRAVSSHL
jgi:BirA family transcriptional regulator, biotin operon repressor / biotin---[acetyl-CoA-carboxylase] ligase